MAANASLTLVVYRFMPSATSAKKMVNRAKKMGTAAAGTAMWQLKNVDHLRNSQQQE
jgi:hypothetical protein